MAKEEKKKVRVVRKTPEGDPLDPGAELVAVIRTPFQLIEALQAERIDVNYVDAKMRRAAVAELDRRGMRGIEIAELFKVSQAQISKDKKKIYREMGMLVDDFDAKGFLGRLIEEAEWHIGVAKRSKDYRLSWQVLLQLQLLLKEYGVLKPPPHTTNEEIQVDPLEAELDKLTDKQIKDIETILAEAKDVTPREEDDKEA